MKRKVVLIFIALNLLGIGINFVLQAGFGCDAITMINDGIARFFHTNYTIAGLIYNTILMVLSLIWAREMLGWGSICYAYATGTFIDIYRLLLEPLQLVEASLMIKVMALLIGQLMMCFAFAMLIELHLGRSSLDALLAKVVEKTHISYRVLKTICDIVFVAIAFLLGSTFGLGTIACVLLGGYTIDFFCTRLHKNEKLSC